MKNNLFRGICLFLSFSILSTSLLAAKPSSNSLEVNAEDIAFDQLAFEKDFELLNEMESLIEAEGIEGYDELSSLDLDGAYTAKFDLTYSVKASQGFDWNNFDWGSGLWGFLCCPIGFFVVAVNKNKTKDQKISFWIGVAAGAVLSAITSPIYYNSYN